MSFDDINREFMEESEKLGILDTTPKKDNVIKAPKNPAEVNIKKAAGKGKSKPSGKFAKSIVKRLDSKTVNNQVIKDNSIRISAMRLAQSVDIDAQNDRSRFFNNNFRSERRQLFFGN